MSEIDQISVNQGTPEMREAVRQQIVVNGLHTSEDIATALDLRHALVVRMLERFEAVGALRVRSIDKRSDAVVIDPSSLSARFQDLAIPLW